MQDKELAEIEEFMDQKIRPYLKEHFGNVEVLGLKDGVIKVRLLGRCSHCPSANITTGELIEKELTREFPGIKEVALVDTVSDELMDMARTLLNDPKKR